MWKSSILCTGRENNLFVILRNIPGEMYTSCPRYEEEGFSGRRVSGRLDPKLLASLAGWMADCSIGYGLFYRSHNIVFYGYSWNMEHIDIINGIIWIKYSKTM